ncbi:MAG: hypothetical protein JST38_07220 [Bacteroidetes bacterium]|nr:hypothetical protein [Bacteroidota bacterium]
MRLDFRVLWIDDLPARVASSEERLTDHAEEEGFHLDVIWATSLEEAKPHLANDIYLDEVDLVLVDYDLGSGNTTGDIGISEIRKKVAYTDIVFYSAKPIAELQELIYKQQVQGIFFAHRTELAPTLIGLFNSLVKKILDLDHSRGIVMGATSDIDQFVSDHLEELSGVLSEDHARDALKYALDKIDKRLKEYGEIRSGLEGGSINTLLEHHELFPAAYRLGLLKRILSNHFGSSKKAQCDEIGQYINEVPPKRNILGHVRVVASGGVRKLRDRRGAKEFSAEDLKTLRRSLVRYRALFEALLP